MRVIIQSKCLLLLVSFLLANELSAQNNLPREDVFQEAYLYYQQHRISFERLGESVDLPPAFVFSIVAPEIVSFSLFSNHLEVLSLKVLYVEGGKKYSNFSIGEFQIKPSFVEQLEAYASKGFSEKNKKAIVIAEGNDKKNRIERISRLDDREWQFKYLRLFLEVMKTRFDDSVFESDESKLCIYATAYNAGFERSLDDLMSLGEMSFFSIFSPFYKRSYCEVSLQFFRYLQEKQL